MAANPKYEEAATGSGYHIPVLFSEVLEGLSINENGVYVDCTFGGGGHSRGILNLLSGSGKLIAFDQDADAVNNLPADERILFVPENFRHMQRFLRFHGFDKVDGVLADLGISSHQIDTPERGFAHRYNASLDMRMDQRQSLTAAQLLNTFSADQLQQMFSAYGEVTNSKTLAQAVYERRQQVPFESISDFNVLLDNLGRGNPNRYRSQVYQALRIAVNEEMIVLEEWLQQLPGVLKPGGRVAVITFHSLEDRMVKNFFKHGTLAEPAVDMVYGTKEKSPFTLINKKPIEPSKDETKRNERARSARLRIAQRL